MLGGFPVAGCDSNQSADHGTDRAADHGGARGRRIAVAGRAGSEVEQEGELALSLPRPWCDERDALAGLLLARLTARADFSDQCCHHQVTRDLAERLLQPPSLTYGDIDAILGDSDRRRTRAVLDSLSRVGLLFDAGNSVILPERPVSLEVRIGHEPDAGVIEPGETPARLDPGAGVRIHASSRLALELRVYRIAHLVAGADRAAVVGEPTRRSITRHSLARGRLLTLDLEPLEAVDVTHVEQLLLHVSWSTAAQFEDSASECEDAAWSTLAARIENERANLLASAGPGWVTEYLLLRSA